ncbi:uncharacterized protein FTOL_13856 [Fusarium torulosum]|uniref:Uncharacterized protein n=1 Tax=Fusarium torulosum TaxID=33205 RepID=A0AAE8MN83_9HYPO|nr:uncharacterized protein FTOL_13856 [Fusarium torulosum]
MKTRNGSDRYYYDIDWFIINKKYTINEDVPVYFIALMVVQI